MCPNGSSGERASAANPGQQGEGWLGVQPVGASGRLDEQLAAGVDADALEQVSGDIVDHVPERDL